MSTLHGFLSLFLCLVTWRFGAAETVCAPASVLCNQTHVCVPTRYFCDGDDDCGDGEDEQGCLWADSGCGSSWNQTGMNGSFTSMGYPVWYNYLADCRWYIQVPADYNLVLEFIGIFDIEKPHHGSCLYDVIRIYQDNPSQPLGEYCGSAAPGRLLINGSQAVVEFHSDGQTNGQGFMMTWTASPGLKRYSGCDELIEVSDGLGAVTSPYFLDGQPYPSSLDCRWQISVLPDNVIDLYFDNFDVGKSTSPTGCAGSWLDVFDGLDESSTRLGHLCGDQLPREMRSSSNTVLVELKVSDNDEHHLGFALSYAARPAERPTTVAVLPQGCHRDFKEVTATSGLLTSPNFDGYRAYPDNVKCQWLLLGQPGLVFHFTFHQFELEQSGACVYDFLTFYDLSVQHGDTDHTPTSSHDNLTHGHEILNTSSAETFTSNTTRPNITATEITRLCGVRLPYDVESSSNVVLLRFRSDEQDGAIGFNLSYVLKAPRERPTTVAVLPQGCHGDVKEVTATSGLLTSPNFDGYRAYPDNVECQWLLLGQPGHVFHFTFHQFELEQSGACVYDSLTFYDVGVQHGDHVQDTDHTPTSSHDNLTHVHEILNTSSDETFTSNTSRANITATEITRLCGVRLPYDVESSSDSVLLRFRSDEQVGAIGFNLSYVLKAVRVSCHPDEFQCGDLVCINSSLVCDQVLDCSDGTDELVCGTSSDCGRPAIAPVLTRIAGGSEALEGSWPWTLSVTYSSPALDTHVCGATLVHPQWALTAAHCFEGFTTRNYDDFHILAGRHQLNHLNKHEQSRQVDQVFVHPAYVYKTSFNDLALVRVQQPFNLTDHVFLACLPWEPVQEEKLCYITGWGVTLDTCCAERLKQAAVPIMNFSLCSGADYYGDWILEHMMCAGYPQGGVDSCGGDSGGPLVCEGQQGSRRWELQGVTSWGIECAAAHSPGVYTVVYDYLAWIQQTVALNF